MVACSNNGFSISEMANEILLSDEEADVEELYNKAKEELAVYASAKDAEKYASKLVLTARKRRQISFRNFLKTYETLNNHTKFNEPCKRFLRDRLEEINTHFKSRG
jgi:type II secretory pathway component HofQ